MILIKKHHWIVYCYLFAISFAIFIQFPFVNKDSLSSINQIVWLGVAVCTLLYDKRVKVTNYLFFMIGVFLLAFLAGEAFNTLGIIRHKYPTAVMIPILVYFISLQISRIGKGKDTIDIVMYTFLIVTMILALQIAPNLITNFSQWSKTEVYLFSGATHKNSTAQILSCGFLILYLYVKPKTVLNKIFRFIGLTIYIMALLYVQSRASMIATAVAVFAVVLIQPRSKKKLIQIILLVIVILAAFNSDTFMNIFNQAFFVDKYSDASGLNLNTFSSGRLDFWAATWNQFLESPLLGSYVSSCDNFYINTLATGGVFFGGMLIILWLSRVCKNFVLFKNSGNSDCQDKAVFLMFGVTVFYLAISIFEAYPPYGPGVATMLLWILCGYIDGSSQKRRLE